jgi:hypothetical protein
LGYALVLVTTFAIAGTDGRSGPPPVDEADRLAIETTLLEHAVAMNKRDLSRFHNTVDQTRGSFSLCQDRIFMAVPNGGRVGGQLLGSVERYRDYVRGWVSDGVDWRRYYFRQAGDRWVLSEPLPQELGPERRAVFGGVEVTFWSIDDDIVDLVGAALPEVRDFVVGHARVPPKGQFTVRIDPLADPSGGSACLNSGSASLAHRTSTAHIVLSEVRVTTGLAALSTDTLTTLRHEALHWIQLDYSAEAVGNMEWWLVEGWPFLLTEPVSLLERHSAFCRDRVVSTPGLRAGPTRTATYDVLVESYGLAGAAVEYLQTTYGADAYWRIVDGFSSSADPQSAYMTAIGTDPVTFFDGWARWMTERYC